MMEFTKNANNSIKVRSRKRINILSHLVDIGPLYNADNSIKARRKRTSKKISKLIINDQLISVVSGYAKL